MPNAEIRIQTPYAAAPCGSITTIPRKDLDKYNPRDAGALRAGFSLILGLVITLILNLKPNLPPTESREIIRGYGLFEFLRISETRAAPIPE